VMCFAFFLTWYKWKYFWMEVRDDRSASRTHLKTMASIKISLILICATMCDWCFFPETLMYFFSLISQTRFNYFLTETESCRTLQLRMCCC